MISADAIRRRWQERSDYASNVDWLKSIYSRWLRRNNIPAPGRGACWSIRLKADDGPFLFRPGSTDLLVLEEIFIKGEYELLKCADGLENAALIVDLGANVGYSARLWVQLFPSARIIAVEAEPENVKLCRQNCSSIATSGRVDVVEACARSFDGETFFNATGEEWAYSASDKNTPGTVRVRSATLDSILRETNATGQIDLLKCDIEGGEREVFKNPGQWLRRTRHILVEVHPPYSLEEMQRDLAAAGSPLRIMAHGKSSMVALFADSEATA